MGENAPETAARRRPRLSHPKVPPKIPSEGPPEDAFRRSLAWVPWEGALRGSRAKVPCEGLSESRSGVPLLAFRAARGTVTEESF